MLQRTQIIGAALAALAVTPVFGQATITSSYRLVETEIQSGGTPNTFDTNSMGPWTESSEACVGVNNIMCADAMLTSDVSGELISGAGYAKSDGPWFNSIGISRVEMVIEFTIDSPTDFDLELQQTSIWDPGSDIFGSPPFDSSFLFSLDSESGMIAEFNSGPFGDPESHMLSGVLPAGNYTLQLSAIPFYYNTHHGGVDQIERFNTTFDFTLTIPAPSSLALLMLPAGTLGSRRRR